MRGHLALSLFLVACGSDGSAARDGGTAGSDASTEAGDQPPVEVHDDDNTEETWDEELYQEDRNVELNTWSDYDVNDEI